MKANWTSGQPERTESTTVGFRVPKTAPFAKVPTALGTWTSKPRRPSCELTLPKPKIWLVRDNVCEKSEGRVASEQFRTPRKDETPSAFIALESAKGCRCQCSSRQTPHSICSSSDCYWLIDDNRPFGRHLRTVQRTEPFDRQSSQSAFPCYSKGGAGPTKRTQSG